MAWPSFCVLLRFSMVGVMLLDVFDETKIPSVQILMMKRIDICLAPACGNGLLSDYQYEAGKGPF